MSIALKRSNWFLIREVATRTPGTASTVGHSADTASDAASSDGLSTTAKIIIIVCVCAVAGIAVVLGILRWRHTRKGKTPGHKAYMTAPVLNGTNRTRGEQATIDMLYDKSTNNTTRYSAVPLRDLEPEKVPQHSRGPSLSRAPPSYTEDDTARRAPR